MWHRTSISTRNRPAMPAPRRSQASSHTASFDCRVSRGQPARRSQPHSRIIGFDCDDSLRSGSQREEKFDSPCPYVLARLRVRFQPGCRCPDVPPQRIAQRALPQQWRDPELRLDTAFVEDACLRAGSDELPVCLPTLKIAGIGNNLRLQFVLAGETQVLDHSVPATA